MRAPLLADALLFQFTWAACVLGGNRGALLALLLLLPLRLRWVGHSRREWLLAVPIAAAGLAVDLGWQAAGLIRFHDTVGGGFPPWLAVLWLMFAGTLFHSLTPLAAHPRLAALAGAVGGPASYLAGVALGAAHSPLPAWQLALVIAPAWAVLLPLALRLAHPLRAAGQAVPVPARDARP